MYIKRHVDYVEAESLGWQTRDRAWCHIKLGSIGRLCDSVVQVEKKLIGAAPDWRHLPEREPQSYCFREFNAPRANLFVLKQRNEATPAGMGPHVGTQ